MIGAIGFIAGVAVTGLVWYVKDYCMDCLYLKGYKRGYDRAMQGVSNDRTELDIEEL